MLNMPDAIALLAVTLPIAAAIHAGAIRFRSRAAVDAAQFADPTATFELTAIAGRLQSLEIKNEGFRAEVRGELRLIKQMIQFLPSGQVRPGGIGFADLSRDASDDVR